MKTVILAGGKGTRLKPYSTVFPKPLMPIGDMPILEIIIRQLKAKKLNDIIITIGHLGELIMNFFGDGRKWGVSITYCIEDKPLGTAGALGLIKKDLTEPFLMINGDTLTTLNLTDLIDYHKKSGATATLALKKRGVYIDFGIIELDKSNTLTGYIEKPTIYNTVSMGIYVCEPKVLGQVKVNERLDFPDLIKALLAKGETIKGFVYDGYWMDIGRAEDYEKANEEIESLLPKLINP